MAITYRIVGISDNIGEDIIHDFEMKEDALILIDRMTKKLGCWKLIRFIIFDGFDKSHDSTVWKSPSVKWGDDICY